MPGQLSGGQAQRVALARALVKEPAVLLLDEPLGALDLKLRKQMQVELARIHRQVRTTFVFVTHDQEEALSMATTVAVMTDGRRRAARARPVRSTTGPWTASWPTSSASRTSWTGGELAPVRRRLELRTRRRDVHPGPDELGTGPATLMIRPESAHASPGAARAATRRPCPGRVVAVSFLGAFTRSPSTPPPAGSWPRGPTRTGRARRPARSCSTRRYGFGGCRLTPWSRART